VKQFIDTIENNDGAVVFIHVTADREHLIDRVADESRKKYKKLTDSAIMTKITEDMTMYTIPFVASLDINTSLLSPDESVDLIIKKLNLNTIIDS
jgi:RNase adaptor protein for sRNA GlmZ degradation